jgi:citrate lyase beta subunit
LSTRKGFIQAVEDAPRSLGISPAQVPLVMAIFAAEDGNFARARTISAAALDESRGEPFEGTVRHVATRLAIAL